MTGVRDVRLLVIAGAVWGAAFASVLWPDAATAIAVGLWCVSATACGWLCAARGRRARRAAMPLLAIALALGAAVSTHVGLAAPARGELVALVARAGRVVEIDGVVSSKVRPLRDALWFEVETTAIRVGREQRAAAITVTVSVERDALAGAALDLGSTVALRGGARAADPGDRAVLVLFADRGSVVRGPPHVLGVMSDLRDGFVHDVAAGLPEPGAGLLPGLAVGDTRAVSADLDAAMKASSLTHLTAVSGANCAIVTGLAFALAALIRLPRWARVGAALAALGGFVLLVTPEPSVVRAATMAVIAMLGLLLGRAGAGAAALGGAAIVLLLLDPWLATSFGFVLSALATGALLLLAGPLARGLERWLPRALALGIAVPLAAQIACAPVIVLLAPAVPVYGVVANMIAAPAAPLATVVGMLACVLQGVPVVADGLAAIAWVPSAWIAQTAVLFSGLPTASVPWWGGAAGFASLALVGVCVVIVLVRPETVPARLRRAAGASLAVVVGVVSGSTALTGVAGPLTAPTSWSVALCDIGQGDAVLLRSEGAVALVDTGPEPERLASCLNRLGVGRIDLLVVTHFDLDHVGGIAAVSGRVDTALHGPLGADGAQWLAQVDEARLVDASNGMSGVLGGAAWRVLWPQPESRAFPEGNDASVVLEISGGGIPRSLLLGDLGASSQSALRATGGVSGRYDVVKVAHHGSADQDAELYRIARPALALIGVGADNDYGHPAASTLAELRAVGATVARTDEDGLVLVGQSEDGVPWVWRERPRESDPAGERGELSATSFTARGIARAGRRWPGPRSGGPFRSLPCRQWERRSALARRRRPACRCHPPRSS